MRTSGILMSIFSLPSPYGIGTFGKSAYEFVDFLSESKQSYWQILPINPTSYGDSPYQSFSTYAGNPYFIDLDLLIDDKLLKKSDVENINWSVSNDKVDYSLVYKNRLNILRIAAKKFLETPNILYDDFCKIESFWLEDYAVYMVLKDKNNSVSWLEWKKDFKFKNEKVLTDFYKENYLEIQIYKVIQYLFFKQWDKLKAYANNKNIKIIGDLPIYVAMDSVDVWSSPKEFLLDKNFNPVKVAGCPPDAFSKDGQLWGNPLYRWDYMKKNNFAWWVKRINHTKKLYDVIRIDHFRGFDSYYAINSSEKTAKNGEWLLGPGILFFDTIKKQVGNLEIIAEDLGFLTTSVKNLLSQTGYPGMKVLQFAFDSREDSDYLPHNYTKNSVVYTGTHDNDTIMGWLESVDKKDAEFAIKYMRLSKDEGYNWGMIKTAMASISDTVIITMQDLIGLGSNARINTPSTLGNNWQWRAEPSYLTDEIKSKLKEITVLYKRNAKGE